MTNIITKIKNKILKLYDRGYLTIKVLVSILLGLGIVFVALSTTFDNQILGYISLGIVGLSALVGIAPLFSKSSRLVAIEKAKEEIALRDKVNTEEQRKHTEKSVKKEFKKESKEERRKENLK